MRKTQICLAAMIAFLSGVSIAAQNVFRITLDQAIQPITEEYVVNSIVKANADHASLILLDLDTPGGYVDSVEKIQKAILASRAPVVAYVTPSGARAASGGAYIAITCDLLVMAPGTNIGAAHPVSMFSIPTPPPAKPGEEGKKGQASHQQGSVEMEKIVNDLAAHMRTIAVNRHRNAELAEKMVRQSISLTEQEALKGGLINLIADSPQQIFEYVDTHPIRRFNGKEEKIVL
ncbi:MAG: hypothetical protein P8Z49_08930 [Acidobacteriota bacterium]